AGARHAVPGCAVPPARPAPPRRAGAPPQRPPGAALPDARLNLEMVGRLHHLSKREARRQADELLERLDLTDAADRLAKTFSGGLRRRPPRAARLGGGAQGLLPAPPTTGRPPRPPGAPWEAT